MIVIGDQKTQDQESGAAPHILLGAVGDIILHKELQKLAFENDFWQRQSYAEIWKDAIPLLQFPDLLYGNLEGVVSTVRSVALLVSDVQGDHSGSFQPPVDPKTKVVF